MKTFVNVRSTVFGLGVVAAALVGMAQGPRNVANQWSASFFGTSSEDFCEYFEELLSCPDEPGETGCTATYYEYEDSGYQTILTIQERVVPVCADELYDSETGNLVSDGPCDDDTGVELGSADDCQETC